MVCYHALFGGSLSPQNYLEIGFDFQFFQVQFQ